MRHMATSLLAVEMPPVGTVHAPDGVGDLVENHARSDVEQDKVASQEAVLDIAGQWRQGGQNSSGHRGVRLVVRVDPVDVVNELLDS